MSERPDILLIMIPPFGPEMPPLSLASLAAAARGAGFKVGVMDLNIRVYRAAGPERADEWGMDKKAQWVWPTRIEETYARYAAHLDAGVEEMAAAQAGVYGFSCHSDNRLMTLEIIRRLRKKNPEAFVIVGGMGVFGEAALRRFEKGMVDAFVIGPEGEGTLVDILQARRRGRGLADVFGVMTLADGDYLMKTRRKTARDLDIYPWPTFEDFDLRQYTTPNLPVVTSRGCRSRCIFCNDRVIMGPQRNRSAKRLFEEIRHHVEEQGVRDFSINDLQINYNIEEIDELCTLIGKWGEDIRWNANAIVSDALQPSILKNLKAAGCTTLTLGVETGSPRIVKRMNKGFRMDAARRVMRDIKDAGITLWINLVIGFPGENDETVRETMDFVRENAHLIDEVCVCNTCNILEYSTLFEKRDKLGIAPPEDPDWFEVSWRTKDGLNTPEQRMEWLGRVLDLLKEKDIPVRQTNYYFSGENTYWEKRHLDVLLAILPPFETDSPPAELTGSSSYLQSLGMAVSCVDFNIETYRKTPEKDRELWALHRRDEWAEPERCRRNTQALGLDAGEQASLLLARDSDNLAFYIHRANTLVTRSVLKAIREKAPGKRIILFGPSTSIAAERDLFTDELCNYMIVGEVEHSLGDLLRRLAAGEGLDSLRGVRYTLPAGYNGLLKKSTDGLFQHPDKHFIPREPIRDLDSLPKPDYRELRPDKYGPALKIRTSRGCRYRCAFCTQQPFEGPARYRSARAIFEEMAEAHRLHDVRAFEFADLISNGRPRQLDELCGLLIESKLPIRFGADFAPSAEMTSELFVRLRRAGCKDIRFGVESFSDRVLRLMNKSYTAATAMKNLKDAHEAGIETHLNIMIGFPGETPEDFLLTARYLKQAEPFLDFVDAISACRVLPKSAVERDSRKYEVLLPADDHATWWSHKGYNSEPWRATRVKEMAIWVAGLDLKFHYDFFLRPLDGLRRMEKRIRSRLESKISEEVACVIVNLPPWGFTNPPVGPAVLATYLDHHGFPTRVLDYNARWHRQAPEDHKLLWHVENKNFWSNDDTFRVLRHGLRRFIDEAVEEILALSPKIIGFTTVDPRERLVIEVIERIRRCDREVTILLGGPAMFTPEYRTIFFTRAGQWIDGYVVGEGEETLLECARALRDGAGATDLSRIAGLITLDDQGRQSHTPRPPIKDLDSVPFPNYRHFDDSLYQGDSQVLEWSRGCVAQCVYCKGKDLAGAYRSRSAEHIFAEMKYLVEELGITSFTIADNILNGRPRILERVCDLIIEAGLSVRWNAEAAPLKNLTRSLLEKLKKAGCFELQLGLEVGSDRVLELMNKGKLFSVESASQVFRRAHEVGIKTCMFCIVGFPGETEEDFRMTLEMIERNAPWIDQIKSINSCHIITGTELHLQAARWGVTLPEKDYHYLWIDDQGLDIQERNDRIRRVLALVRKLGKECLETNLTEGKQLDLAAAVKAGGLSMDAQFQKMLELVNNLGSFDSGRHGDGEKPPNAESLPPAPAPDLAPHFVEENLALSGVLSKERVYAGPEILEIDLTNRCNLHCVGCWNHGYEMGEERWKGEMFRRTLPRDVALAAIDQAAVAGARMVQLSGAGDPMLHPDFLDIVARIKSHGLKCTVITNGTLLTGKAMRRFVELGLDDLTVSVWAGTQKTYAATHPKTKPGTILKIRRALRRLHKLKRDAKKARPHVKIYNVINHVNARGVDDMITFALECLADHVEFTPIDIVAGKTDHLALTPDDRDRIRTQLDGLVRRDDYLELDPTQSPKSLSGAGEGKEFARFVKYDILPDDFRYELDDIRRFDVLCRRKEWRLDIREDNKEENALFFGYPEKECRACPLLSRCGIDKDAFHVRVEFLSVLGFGAFYRRITSPQAAGGGYDAETVRDLPCNIGWTYARIGTDALVIPCCKAKEKPMGDLRESEFLDIWASPRYREFRSMAMERSKDDPYFASIACLKACDNLGMIFKTGERISALSKNQKKALLNPEDSGFGEI